MNYDKKKKEIKSNQIQHFGNEKKNWVKINASAKHPKTVTSNIIWEKRKKRKTNKTNCMDRLKFIKMIERYKSSESDAWNWIGKCTNWYEKLMKHSKTIVKNKKKNKKSTNIFDKKK